MYAQRMKEEEEISHSFLRATHFSLHTFFASLLSSFLIVYASTNVFIFIITTSLRLNPKGARERRPPRAEVCYINKVENNRIIS